MDKHAPPFTIRAAVIFTLIFVSVVLVLVVLGVIVSHGGCWACGS
jgi:hypothetical protein